MMTFQELQNQIRQLQQQAEAMRREEASAVIAKLRAAILEFGITPAEVFGASAKQIRRSPRGPATQKYRDPLSGATWSGRGRAPRWIVGRNRDDFLITRIQ
ncbi:H-NS histone family protein [Burkholderia pseudomallei]|nr:H-NS histone family protein [Burkholderia pseudomallei]MBO3037560.1 H-NS histone family protein [Burkholderia pseudomallei]MBO7824573.1 H-NS histone family protein [Burkholderia pseudomallei]MBO7845272.1 H-NS histone family protein [Burkholderia pseudomallei]MBO7860342.1 H-NS histone family protein [Burkholderia pseudomallei]